MSPFRTSLLEATRLTRDGRLKEAMAILRGAQLGPAGQERGPQERPGFPTDDAGSAAQRAAEKHAAFPGSLETRFAEFVERRIGRPWPGLIHPPGGPTAMPGLRGLGTPSHVRAPSVPDGARFETRTFASAAGSRHYKLYVPSRHAGAPLPLVVMLHGCTQSPDDFAAGTRMNELAEEHLFLVAYPAQAQAANQSKCWNWFNPGDQQRDRGEPALIAGITREVMDDFPVEPGRVYVAGLSAGGAAAAIMGVTYPDLYRAIGVHSGLACGAASDIQSAFAAMRAGAPARSLRAAGRGIPTIVFHGDCDRTVSPINGEQIIAQTKADGQLRTEVFRGQARGLQFTRTVHASENGRPLLEQWVVHGGGHAWSGGSPDGSYTDPRGPDASREMIRFFFRTGGVEGVTASSTAP